MVRVEDKYRLEPVACFVETFQRNECGGQHTAQRGIGGVELAIALDDRQGFLEASRAIGLVASGLVLALCVPLVQGFDSSTPAMQFVVKASWLPAWNVDFHLGVDGLSMLLIVLSALISFIATIASVPWLSGKAHLEKVGKVTREQLEEIAKMKIKDLTAADMDAAVKTIAGSARSMGLVVEGV